MRTIDMLTWSRRDHFKFFNSFDHPHFGLCANVDLTHFHPYLKQNGISFSVAVVYMIARTANAIPEFRVRIRPGAVIEHELVHPSYTLLIKEDLFSFCTLEFTENFPVFARKAVDQIAYVKEHYGLTRKYAIPLLEYLDRERITRRMGEHRVLL